MCGTAQRVAFSGVRRSDRSPRPGDQFYYRIHILRSESDRSDASLQEWRIPERNAPELDALWRNAQPAP
uniref:hypothetical protein n=1 Tax=Lonsdalea britannica TaxID=1082704 RepID=UPI003908BC32